MSIAEPILLQLQHVLGKQPRRNLKEQEFIVAMHKSWEDARIEGRTEGHAEGQANAVLAVLRVRGVAVPEAVRKRILAEKNLQRLERWLERASLATSLSEVLDDRTEGRSSKPARPVAHKERGGRKPARVPAQR